MTIRLLGLIWLVVLGAGLAAANEREPVGVRIVDVSSRALDPGTFSSLIAEVENFTSRPQTITLDLVAPPGWVVVSHARTVRIGVLERRSVPFTVQVPERATDDEGHEFILVLSTAEGAQPVRHPHKVRVTPRQAIELRPLQSLPHVQPGERARYTLRVENAGNVSDLYSLAVESTPPWDVSLQPQRVFLRPGESMDVLVEVEIPRRTVPGTLNHLVVTATASQLDLREAAQARAQLSAVVVARPHRSSRFHRIPLEVTTSAGRNRRDESTYALRLLSDGRWGDDRWLTLETDLRSEGPEDTRQLGLQRARARLSGPTWEVSVGDVWSDIADAVSPTVGGRGGRVLKESAHWTTEGFVHVARGDERLPSPTWGGQAALALRPDLWIDGGFLTRTAETPPAAATGLPRETFLTVGTRWTATPQLELRTEAALSHEVVDDFTTIGHAGEILADYRGEAFQVKARGYSGQPKFAGRIRNEQAVLAHARTTLDEQSTLWANVDFVRNGARSEGDPVELTRNVRLAGHFGDPGSEITFDSQLDRTSGADGSVHARKELFTVWSWRQMGPLLLGLSGKGGWNRDERADSRGILWGGAAQVVGRVRGVRTSVTVDRSSEYRLDALENFAATAVHGDLNWIPARRPISLGLEFRSHSAGSPAGVATTTRSLRPRAEWRWGSATRLRLDGTFEEQQEDFGLTEWRLQIVWSGEDALPLLWNPRDANPRGRVFLDVDLDGVFGPRDTPLAGVRVSVDGQPLVSDDHGEFEFPPAIGSSYRIELQPGAVPPDLVPADHFPRELPVAAPYDRFFEIPLVRGGGVSGRIFHDQDRDGRAGSTEPGLGDVRMEILREGRRVATNLSDPQGEYSFGKLPPGDYTLRVAPGWMPAGWQVTGHPELRIRLAPDGSARVDPLGLAPHRKPILKTFDGTSGAP